MRRSVIDAASRLLVDEGPQALTVRRLASELECSTKILYTMFSGKDDLASALYLEGCARLQAALANIVPPKEPAQYLWRVARAYWGFSLAHTGYYRVMFGGAIPRFVPGRADIDATANALAVVVRQLQRYIDARRLEACDPVMVVRCLWAAVHGAVSLNLLGHFETPAQALELFEETTGSLLLGLVDSR